MYWMSIGSVGMGELDVKAGGRDSICDQVR